MLNHTTPVGVRYEGAARMLKEHSGLEIAINNYDRATFVRFDSWILEVVASDDVTRIKLLYGVQLGIIRHGYTSGSGRDIPDTI